MKVTHQTLHGPITVNEHPINPVWARDGRLLASWRKEHGLTMGDLATLTNKRVSVVSDWEHGRAVIPQRILDLINRRPT